MKKGKVLFRVEGRLSPGDSGRVRVFTFQVPRESKSLRVFFDYEPLFLEDEEMNRSLVERAVREYIKEEDPLLLPGFMSNPIISRIIKSVRNILNLLVYDPEGNFRGRWDYNRMKREGGKIGLSPSPGFLMGPVTPGRWSVEVEVFGVFTPDCTFFIEVHSREEEGEDGMERPALRFAPPLHQRAHLKGELHSHSIHSDGALSLSDLVRRSLDYGLDFLAVTDHNTASQIQEMEAISGFPLIPGYELSTFSGHFNVYGLSSFIPWHSGEVVAGMNDVADEVHGKGGLFSLVHPYAIMEPVCVGCPFRIRGFDFGKIDMIEVWSGEYGMRFPEIKRAISLWDRLQASGHRITGVGGADWHSSGEGGRYEGRNPLTFVIDPSPSPAGILHSIRRGRAYISTGPEIDFHLLYGRGEMGEMGDRLNLPEGTGVEIPVSLRGCRRAEVRLLNHGRVEECRVWSGEGPILFERRVRGPCLYRVEVWKISGNEPLLITNHIEVIPF